VARPKDGDRSNKSWGIQSFDPPSPLSLDAYKKTKLALGD